MKIFQCENNEKKMTDEDRNFYVSSLLTKGNIRWFVRGVFIKKTIRGPRRCIAGTSEANQAKIELRYLLNHQIGDSLQYSFLIQPATSNYYYLQLDSF